MRRCCSLASRPLPSTGPTLIFHGCSRTPSRTSPKRPRTSGRCSSYRESGPRWTAGSRGCSMIPCTRQIGADILAKHIAVASVVGDDVAAEQLSGKQKSLHFPPQKSVIKEWRLDSLHLTRMNCLLESPHRDQVLKAIEAEHQSKWAEAGRIHHLKSPAGRRKITSCTVPRRTAPAALAGIRQADSRGREVLLAIGNRGRSAKVFDPSTGIGSWSMATSTEPRGRGFTLSSQSRSAGGTRSALKLMFARRSLKSTTKTLTAPE